MLRNDLQVGVAADKNLKDQEQFPSATGLPQNEHLPAHRPSHEPRGSGHSYGNTDAKIQPQVSRQSLVRRCKVLGHS